MQTSKQTHKNHTRYQTCKQTHKIKDQKQGLQGNMKIPKTMINMTTFKEATNIEKPHRMKDNKDDKDTKQTLIKEYTKQDKLNRHGKIGNRTRDSFKITFETFTHQDASFL